MDAATRTLIEALHQAPIKYALVLTGGGTTAAADLLSVPGGSRTILEVAVPYHENALADYLGHAPDQYCSVATARLLAIRARERAAWLVPRERVLGAACTASLATDRPKRGEHRFHVATASGRHPLAWSLTLTKGARDRAEEEAVVDAVLLNALAESAGIAERMSVPLLPGEELHRESQPAGGFLDALLGGAWAAVCQEEDGRWRADAPPPQAVLPGSFNPLHEGHGELAQVAAKLLGCPVAFELSVTNADKPSLAIEEVDHRRRQFLWRAPLWLTNAPTFADKAALFPGATFVVGADTAVRIVSPRFYGGDVSKMSAALGRIRDLGCRFLVAGRVEAQGRFLGCEALALPAEWCDLFAGIPESAFRRDVSSTQLRARPDSL